MSGSAASAALWYASRATGIVAMVLLTLVVVLGVVVAGKVRVPGLPRFTVIGLHRRVSLIAVTFLAVHVLTAVADSYVTARLAAVLVPFTSGYEPLPIGLGAVALDLGIAVLVTSLLRARIGWRLWRLVHWLGYAAYPVAVVHGFTSAKDLRSGRLLTVTVVCAVAVAGAVGGRPAAGAGAVSVSGRRAGAPGWPGLCPDQLPTTFPATYVVEVLVGGMATAFLSISGAISAGWGRRRCSRRRRRWPGRPGARE